MKILIGKDLQRLPFNEIMEIVYKRYGYVYRKL